MESTLIIDDNSDACRLMTILLEQLGERATCMSSGKHALQYLKTHIPRLILLDAIMPDMEGVEVLKQIRKDSRLAAVPVVMFSSGVEDADFAQYVKDQGAAEFWVKSAMLFNNLKQLLAPYLTRVTLPPPATSTAPPKKKTDPRMLN